MAEQRDRWDGHRDQRVYWGSFCMNLGSSCIHYSFQGWRGDPLGVLSSSSGPALDESESFTSDITHESPRISTNNTSMALDRNAAQTAVGLGKPDVSIQAAGGSTSAPGPDGGVPSLSGVVTAEMGSGRVKCISGLEGLRICGLGCDPNQGAGQDCLRTFPETCSPIRPGSRFWRVVHEPMFCSRMTLMIMLTLVVVVFSACAYQLAKLELRRTVRSAGATMQRGLLLTAQERFDQALQVNAASALALARFSVSSIQSVGSFSDYYSLLDKVAPFLWIAYSARPESALVGFLASSGEVFAYTRSWNTSLVDNTSLVYAVRPSSGASTVSTVSASCVTPTSYDWYYQPVNQSNGRPTNASEPIDCLFYTPRPSVVQAALNDSSGRAFWTILVAADGDVLLASMQAVVLPGSQSPSGVMITSMSISNDPRWLGKQNLLNGDFYVVDEHGNLLMQTGSQRPKVVAPQQQPSAESSDNPVVAESSKYLSNRLGNLSTLAAKPYSVEKARINGNYYRIQSIPLDPICKCLVAVVVLPQRSILSSAGRGAHRLLVIYMFIAVALIMLGCFLILLLTKGVSGAMQREQSYIAQVKAVKSVEKRTHHKHQFFANMSHDLRTPLAAIIGLIDMILSDRNSIASELEANMVQMKSCANSLLGIMNSILDLSNLEGGKLDFNPCDFDLVSILEEVVDTFAVVGLKKDVEVVLELPDDSIETCRWVHGDSRHVKQVVHNLLSNAVKFTGEGGQVAVRVWPKPIATCSLDEGVGRRGLLRRMARILRWDNSLPTDANTRCQGVQDSVEYEFEVDDTGVGIPPARREAVFHNFVQASSRVHRVHGGAGLGLAIVRSLVHIMGGHIWIANKQEPGTLIKFDLTFQKSVNEVVPSRAMKRFYINGKGRESSADNFRKSGNQCHITLAQHLVKEENRLSLSSRREEGDVQVLLAMQGKVGKQLVYTWMEKRGAVVWDVPEWNDISTTFRCIISNIVHHFSPQSSPQANSHLSPRSSYRQTSPSRFSPPRVSTCSSLPEASKTGVQDFLPLVIALIDVALIPQCKEFQPSKFRGELENYRRWSHSHGYFLHIVWIVSPDARIASSSAWPTLRSRSDSTLSKPVHGSRLIALAEEINSRYRKEVLVEKKRSLLMRPPSPSRMNSSPGNSTGQGQETVLTSLSPKREGSPIQVPAIPSSKSSPVGHGEEELSPQNAVLDHVELEIVEMDAIEVGPVTRPIEPSDEAPKSLVVETESGANLAGIRILLVEDTAVMQLIASQMLRKEGAIVTVARNGKEAVEMVAGSPAAPELPESSTQAPEMPVRSSSNEFDLVLMDCQMPVMDGYTATAKIRDIEQGGHLPIVALTAHGGMVSDQQKCMDAGMDAYITKPLQLDTLLAAMAQLNIGSIKES